MRAFRATEYVKLLKEYEIMKWEPKPLNPLAHTDLKMTLAKYAEKGSDSEMAARRRCIDKYYGDKDKMQNWMKAWVEKNSVPVARQESAREG